MFFSHVELFVFAIIQTQKKTTVQAKILGNLTTSLKPSQNKKGQKNFQVSSSGQQSRVYSRWGSVFSQYESVWAVAE